MQKGGGIRIAVFASGSGSNFQAIVDQIHAGELEADIRWLVCDKPQAKVVERARQANIPVFAFRPKEYDSREQYETEILQRLREENVELIVLAGYMRLLTDVLVKAYEGRMINIHPSLLPAFPGLNAVGQAVQYGVKVTGVTVHFVDGGMDTGQVIAQRAIEIQEDDTEESLAKRIHLIEHKLYSEVIRLIGNGKVVLEEKGRRVQVG